ncbi:membrane protein [Paraliobacillus quinghaiensis]|uniref:Membrane protein n=1 Tax=Paraliobacillus quinghaiensis TaxID=470815 RepID=A0A917WWJ2_9BACI|nr:PDZ domain-containing protein [Paraliobacillus quinghaiensis]GGM35272.1 membrane protein [Paraliobacillus quinghaiensis]
MEAWLIELAKGVGKFFLNPLVYWFFIITLLASISRIKKERKNFGTKIFDAFEEMRHTWKLSLPFGFILSIIVIGLGITFDIRMIAGIALFSILFSISKKFSWLSVAYTFGFTYIALLFSTELNPYLPSSWTGEIERYQWVLFTTLMGVFIIFEAIMMLRVQQDETFPELKKGTRGKWIGQHRMKKITLVPFVGLLPAGLITPFADWWPLISIGDAQFGLIIVPIIVGFEHVVRGSLATKATHGLGQSLLILGFLVIGFSIAGYYITIFTLVSVIIAIIGRELLALRFRLRDQNKQAFFTPIANGLSVLGVIPGTPAENIGLVIGEKIIKVNGQTVTSEQEFYEALQLNSAYCKLDIRDIRGEIRFAQRALYQGEHHELGVIFPRETTWRLDEAK